MKKKRVFRNKLKKWCPGLFLILRTIICVFLRDKRYIEKVIMFEDNPENDYLDIKHNGSVDYGKILYVIKENSNREGFCATLRFIIGFILYAKEHGFAPVIRLSKDFIYYDEEMSKEISNPWEYYFLAPENDYDENVAKHVCYCRFYHMMDMEVYPKLHAYYTENYYDEELFKACSPVIRDYFSIKPEIVCEAKKLLDIERDGMILGVHFRGTDFKQGFNEHPVFVDIEQTIEAIKKAIELNNIGAVFLATDDESAYKRIKESIDNVDLLHFEDVYRSDGDKSVAFSESERKYHRYLLGYEIVRDMYTLSLCDGLIAGKSSVSFLSNLYKHSRNEEYKYMQILDNGNNENNKNFQR